MKESLPMNNAWVSIWLDEANKPEEKTWRYWEEPQCTCGVTITMGKDDHWHFHSDYCDVYKKGKQNDKTSSGT